MRGWTRETGSSGFQKSVIDACQAQGWDVLNVHGSPWQKSGRPDLIITCPQMEGSWYAECKVGRATRCSDIQKLVMRRLRDCGAVAVVLRGHESGEVTIEDGVGRPHSNLLPAETQGKAWGLALVEMVFVAHKSIRRMEVEWRQHD